MRKLVNAFSVLSCLLGCAAACVAAERVDFTREILPLLRDNCFACHGPGDAQAGLRLDGFDAATLSAILPGDSGRSDLIARVTSADPASRMPPPETKKPRLTEQQVELLKRWIDSGTEYRSHWAFAAPTRTELPSVRREGWARNEVDHFVLARLEQQRLTPAPQASRRELARRVSLDLTGLPPSPEVLQQYLDDKAPGAYERLVDRLLASPEWGEHRARYWLDYARYADTHGIHFDNYREIWAYRDWVIEAFNRNLPFDQFTRENLAGDLLPDATLEQQLASGFNRCNITTNEGGAIDEEYLVLYTRDRVETTSQVWLGLTAGCAVCHDHKYDPLTQREFYELAAFFNNTTQAAMDGNVHDTPPTILAPPREERERWRMLNESIAAAEQSLAACRSESQDAFDAWLTQPDHNLPAPACLQEDLLVHAPLDEGSSSIQVSTPDGARELTDGGGEWVDGPSGQPALRIAGGVGPLEGVGAFDKSQPFSCAAWLHAPDKQLTGAIAARMQDGNQYAGWDFWLADRRVGVHLDHTWPNNALKVTSATSFKPNEWTHVAVTYDGSGKAAGVKVYVNGQPVATKVEADKLTGSITENNNEPLRIGERGGGASIAGVAVQDLRIYDVQLAAAQVALLSKNATAHRALAKPANQRSETEVDDLQELWLAAFDDQYQHCTAELIAHQQQHSQIARRAKQAMVMHERDDPAEAYLLFRGEYDQRRDRVTPGTPAMLPPMPADLPRNRLGFAEWLLRPEHPLTARVTVNRCWQEVFGEGLVSTAGDFGVSGTPPSHPELLDWLAVEFRESGWDLKRLYRLMVTSSAYRQSAEVTPEKLERDRANALLSRGPRFRMDGEMVRDAALFASGLLVNKLGGPSVRPYQPPGVWEAVAMPGSNTRDYQADQGDGLYRRSLYTFWKRAAPPASLETFNAPSREYCVVKRERTNTPLQSLVTLNDEQFFEAARCLAELALHDAEGFDQRLDFLSLRLVSRRFTQQERLVIRESLEELLQNYQATPDDAAAAVRVGYDKPDESLEPVELAAWAALANQLMNLDEVLNK